MAYVVRTYNVTIVNKGSSLTIVNQGSTLTIVNEGSLLTITTKGLLLTLVNETTNFMKRLVFGKKITFNFIECRLMWSLAVVGHR